MKRFFKRKNKRSQSTEGESGGVRSLEEQPSDPAQTVPPSIASKRNTEDPARARKDTESNTGMASESTGAQKNGSGPEKTDQSAIAQPPIAESKQSSKPSEINAPVSTETIETTSTKESSANSNTLRQAMEKTSLRNVAGNGKDETVDYADTDSDDAILPSERAEYKGVSNSFRGLNATEPFEDSSKADPDGRIARISSAYDSIPLIEQTKLPRGGISMETKAIGRIQVRLGT